MKREGQFLRHIACVNPECGSSDGLALYQKDDKIDGYCWSCRTYFRDPLGNNREEKTMPMEKSTESVKSILEYPVFELKDRGISESVAKMYGVHIGIDPTNGEGISHYYPVTIEGKLTGWKKRDIKNKKFISIGHTKGADFFGQHLFGSRGKMVVITEGECDAMAAYQMFAERGKNYRVWSLPHGANASSVKDHIEALEKFESVFLCLDQDEQGQKASDEIANLLSPGKVHIMELPEKDPNEMLRKGMSKEFWKALSTAREHKPDGIVAVEDVLEEAIKPIDWGLSWPWESLTGVTYGIRRKELYGFGGGTGAGKTEGFKEVINHMLTQHDVPVGVFFLEEAPAMTLKVLAGKAANKMFHVPDGGWTEDELRQEVEKLRGKVYLYNHFGQRSWETIRSKIRYMVVALGIKDIFLDHLTALVADEADVNKALETIMADMAGMTHELDFTLYYISHLSTPLGRSHEEGGRVTASQFRGSRTISYWSHYLFGYERNQQAEDELERNTVTLRCLKDRYTGLATGNTLRLQYSRENGRLGEVTEFDTETEF